MSAKIELERSQGALEPMFALLDAELTRHEVDDRTAFGIKLAAEELFTNLVRHNVAKGNSISFHVDFTADRLYFELVDHDVEPFDPESIPEYDRELPMAEREPGGVGVYLVRSLVDRLTYEYLDRELRVSVTKYRKSKEARTFEIQQPEDGLIRLVGRLDSAASVGLEQFLEGIKRSAVIDCRRLTYISSDGLGKMFAAQKRLKSLDAALTLRNLTPHIREVFTIAGFHTIFEIE